MTGVLLVDKPENWTSFDVVNYVRKIVAAEEGKKPKNVKVGHCGTLDPFATGLLIILIGKEYTRQAQSLTKLDKTYEMTMHFAASSTTGDPEGEIIPNTETQPSADEFNQVVQELTGVIQQIPPAFSAIKIDGQRAYKLARAGKEVKIEPRQVTINDLKISQYDYPEAHLVADVSSGTYIRVLVEDIAKKLGCQAYTSALRRTKIGDYSIDDAIQVEGINSEIIQQNLVQL